MAFLPGNGLVRRNLKYDDYNHYPLTGKYPTPSIAGSAGPGSLTWRWEAILVP
jgi:hypothetical protein